MQRSRSRKLTRLARDKKFRPAEESFAKLVRRASIGAAVMAAMSAAHAQTADTNNVNPLATSAQVQHADATAADDAANQNTLQEVIVTANKQAVNIQALPMTVTAITGAQLTNQNVQNFSQLAVQNPQIQFISASPAGGEVFMRGINGQGNANTGGGGSVSVYLNNQPITLVGGQVQWHMYDMARIETLPGPQGTLYGAAAEAGTVREITNQPDLTHFSASYTAQLNTIYNGTLGGIAEGFVNVPLSSNIAARLVGWYERDSGFVNNVPQTITFANGFTLNNAPYVQKHFNPSTVEGGRAMFTFKINDNWSINPSIMTQRSRWDGKGNLQEDWKDPSDGTDIPSKYSQAIYSPSIGTDAAVDYSLSVLGKIGDFNITFDSGYTQRDTREYAEYVDYALAYQSVEPFWPSNPTMYLITGEDVQMITNELHVTTPTDWRVHGIVGVYQDHGQIIDHFWEPLPGLNPNLALGTGTAHVWPNTVYLDAEESVNRNWAAFAQFNYDVTSHLTATAGFRRFRYDNTSQGFYGYGKNYALAVYGSTHLSGEELCFQPPTSWLDSPCQDQNAHSESWGSVPLFSLSYKFDPDRLVYATFSKGFRPGGPNRTFGTAPYTSDFLTNYEIGWKTSWFDHHLVFNGDVFIDVWKNYQFNFSGPNGIGVTANAGNAESKGWDESLQWLIVNGLTFNLNVSYADAFLTSPYCKHLASDGSPITTPDCVGPGVPNPSTPLAPNGARLSDDSVWSGFASLRYSFPFADGTAFVEGDQSYKSFYWTNLEPQFQVVYGQVPSYGLTNVSLGLNKSNWQLELLVSNVFNRDAIIDKTSELQAAASLVEFNVITPPRLIGLQWTQSF